MAVPQHPTSDSDDAGQARDGPPPPTPDEDGPHDVPNDTVIEKTLPATPASDAGSGGAAPSRDKPQA